MKKNRRKRTRRREPPWQSMSNAHYVGDDPQTKLLEEEPGFVGVFINHLYQVTLKEFEWAGKTVGWLVIRRKDCAAIHDWRHLQRIKNDLFGKEREAVEIYPAESRLVDTSNQYHLFVLPEGERVPFGYEKRMVGDKPYGVNKNRPFDDPPPDLNENLDDDLWRQI